MTNGYGWSIIVAVVIILIKKDGLIMTEMNNTLENRNELGEEKTLLTVKDMTLVAVFAAIVTVCSFIRIPLGAIPFTLQTLGVFTAAGILGVKRSVISMVIYELLGLVGIPVFGGKGGLSVIVGPTGGYITGFIFTVLIAAFIIDNVKVSNDKLKYGIYFISFIIGDVICFVLGTIQFMLVSGNSLSVSLTYCVTPFIIPDIAKAVVAVIISLRVKSALNGKV